MYHESMQGRIAREAATVKVMIRDYCRHVHAGGDLCPACRELNDYALEKLWKCPFGEGKTVCSRCLVHCYRPGMRQRIRVVMRYAGPRMIYCHPLRAVRHLLDKRRKSPLKTDKKKGER